MILLNFAHPLTSEQAVQIEVLLGRAPAACAVPPRFEVAEVVDLQGQRDAARRAR
jgi:hypothetical protein